MVTGVVDIRRLMAVTGNETTKKGGDIVSLVSTGLILAGLGLGAVALFGGRGKSSLPSEATPKASSRPTDRLDPHVERAKALDVVDRSQTLRLLGEADEREVRSTITLAAMTQTNGSWEETGVNYRALELSGNVWIFRIPRREGGDDVWIKAARLDSVIPLMEFFKGDEAKPGPARQFKNNGQTTPVPFQLPPVCKDKTDYELTDIGRFKATVDGDGKQLQTGDQYPFVTAFTADRTGVLLYLDSRKDMARGTGGLFQGEVFEPEVDIASLL